MFTYKPVSLPELAHIQREVLSIIHSNKYAHNTLHDVYSPKFFSNCTHLKQTIDSLIPWNLISQINIVSHAPSIVSAHVDDLNGYYGLLNGITFNIPIYNCKDTACNFYQPLAPPTLVTPDDLAGEGIKFNKPYWSFTEIKSIDSMKGNTAGLFNTQVPHMPVNTTKEHRIVLSLRYLHDVDVMGYFKD